MPEMTLQEALQTNEVKGFLGGQVREAVEQLLEGDDLTTKLTEAATTAATAAVTAALPQIQESVREELRAESDVRELHSEALRLIEASSLKGAAKQNLLDDYGLAEGKPGRALALVECVREDGKVTKTAKQVLAEQVDADIKRQRNILREAAPSVPRAPGGSDPGDPPAESLVDSEPAWAQRLRARGKDPALYGGPAAVPDPAAAA